MTSTLWMLPVIALLGVSLVGLSGCFGEPAAQTPAPAAADMVESDDAMPAADDADLAPEGAVEPAAVPAAVPAATEPTQPETAPAAEPMAGHDDHSHGATKHEG
jgi:hypothetical protein